ncbi:hypothetical protein C8Q76DRAFT_699033 [Earliella scabrosa]|nr:hypothetical protein C8Q76DRAFT_699033 [Earliella scabrosa]
MKYLPPNHAVRIASAIDLLEFQDDVHEDPDVAWYAKDVTIMLSVPFSLVALRACLLSSINVVDLVLFLPYDMFADILPGIHFPRLQLFKTNLPHRLLKTFLTSHNTITDLCLQGCGRAPGESCPLRLIDLSHVTAVECALECVSATTHPALMRLTAERMRDASPCPALVLRTLHAPLVALFALTLDFLPDDYDLLDRIVVASPRVQRLKLLERSGAFRRNDQSRRSWNDSTRWAKCLFRLDSLSDLALRTASSLTGPLSTPANELRTVKRWSSKRSRPSRSVVLTHEHPTLKYVRVWYRCEQPGGAILTSWSKTSGKWRNSNRLRNPPPDVPF